MTDRSNYFASSAKWLKKDRWPAGEGEVLLIKDVRDQEFKNKDGTSEHKLVLEWRQDVPPMTLNKTNYNWLLGTFGGNDDNWVGKRVYVWHDPTVEYPKGTRVGGLALDKAPMTEIERTKAAIAGAHGLEQQKQDQQAHGDPDDDIPF